MSESRDSVGNRQAQRCWTGSKTSLSEERVCCKYGHCRQRPQPEGQIINERLDLDWDTTWTVRLGKCPWVRWIRRWRWQIVRDGTHCKSQNSELLGEYTLSWKKFRATAETVWNCSGTVLEAFARVLGPQGATFFYWARAFASSTKNDQSLEVEQKPGQRNWVKTEAQIP